MSLQKSRPPFIIGDLLVRRMCDSIHFHNQHALVTNEVSNIRSQRTLPHKLEAIQRPVSQGAPQLALRLCHAMTQVADVGLGND